MLSFEGILSLLEVSTSAVVIKSCQKEYNDFYCFLFFPHFVLMLLEAARCSRKNCLPGKHTSCVDGCLLRRLEKPTVQWSSEALLCSYKNKKIDNNKNKNNN